MVYPAFFNSISLKSKLSWLYYETFHKHPEVRTMASNQVLTLVREHIVKTRPINDIDASVFEIAEECVMEYPKTTKQIEIWGQMGVGYYLLYSPVCFLVPYILFEARPMILSPWIDPIRDKLTEALSPGWKEDTKFGVVRKSDKA